VQQQLLDVKEALQDLAYLQKDVDPLQQKKEIELLTRMEMEINRKNRDSPAGWCFAAQKAFGIKVRMVWGKARKTVQERWKRLGCDSAKGVRVEPQVQETLDAEAKLAGPLSDAEAKTHDAEKIKMEQEEKAKEIQRGFESQVQTLEDGTVVGDAKREAIIAATFTWKAHLPAFFAKHDKGRLSAEQIEEICDTYGKNPQRLAEVLIGLYGEDPRSAAVQAGW
jgi:hypothetical protein